MISRSRHIVKATAAMALLLISFTGCRHTKTQPPPQSPPARRRAREQYDRDQDHGSGEQEELGRGREQNRRAVSEGALNPIVQRVHGWVIDSCQKRRQEQTLEKDSKSKPRIRSSTPLLKDGAGAEDRLAARKDVRDAVVTSNSPCTGVV
jgi:hypothetical protein